MTLTRYRSSETEAARFQAIARKAVGWLRVDQFVYLCDEHRFWSIEMQAASDYRKGEIVKRLLKGLHDHHLRPVFAAMEIEDDAEDLVWVYRAESIFTPDDYALMAAFHGERPGPHHRKLAQYYAQRGRRQFGATASTRRDFLRGLAFLGMAPTVAGPGPAPAEINVAKMTTLIPPTPRRGRHAVFVATLAMDFQPETVSDQPITYDGPSNVIDCGLTLKAATRRCHDFNRQQLAAGLPVKQWSFVVAICPEVSQ
jgi:hypothetical protein